MDMVWHDYITVNRNMKMCRDVLNYTIHNLTTDS